MRLEDRGQNLWATFTADMERYGGGWRPWSFGFVKRLAAETYSHPALIAVVVYRYGQWVFFRVRLPVVRQLLDLYYYLLFVWVRSRLQIELPRTTAIDGGLRIDHFGPIIVNCQLIAGKNLTMTSGVVIGQTDTGVPTFGDGVSLAVGVKVIGGIHLGDNVTVGAGAVVTKTFPNDVIIAGVPAKVIRIRSAQATDDVSGSTAMSESSSDGPADTSGIDSAAA